MWKREYAGSYLHSSGWRIEKSCDGGWVLRNPETGRVFDRMPTKRELMRHYGTEEFSRQRDFEKHSERK